MFRHLQQVGITTSESSRVLIFSSAHLGNIKTPQYLRPHLDAPPSTVNISKVPESSLHCFALGGSSSKPWCWCILAEFVLHIEMTKKVKNNMQEMWVSAFSLAVCLESCILQITGGDVNVWWLKSRVLSTTGNVGKDTQGLQSKHPIEIKPRAHSWWHLCICTWTTKLYTFCALFCNLKN